MLMGGGGHCRSIIDTIKKRKEFNIIGILDTKEKVGTNIDHIKIIGTDNDLIYYYKQGVKYAFVSVGSVGTTELRIKLYEYAQKFGLIFPTIIDETAIISNNSVIHEGTFVGKGVIINSNTKIGKNCIINTGAIVEHDCTIGNSVHIAPGSTLSGGVVVGENTHIGTNTTIIQYITIGSNTIIGAGSVVIKDVKNNVKAYGNPCKEVE